MEKLNTCGDLIRLIVKAPDQQTDDLTVECQLNWTVEKLKNHLHEVYPTKPKKEEQKVIFSGQILNDSMILKDVLQQNYNTNEEVYTIHLVCPTKPYMMKAKSTVNELPPSSSSSSSATSSLSSSSSTVQEYYNRLNNQQIVWMQQAYTQYLTQYLQLMNAHGMQLQPTGTSTATTMPFSQSNLYTNIFNNNSNNARDVDGEQVQTGPNNPDTNEHNDINNNNNNNNNNNAEDNDVVLNRDWLDVFDVFARIVVLTSIVYFYSSPSRFLIVTFLGFAIYLIQGGFFRGHQIYFDNNNGRVENNNNHNVNNNNTGNDQTNGPVGQQQQNQNGQTNNNSEANTQEARTTTNQNEDNERPGALAFTWTFFSSFFASLIPEQPHVL
ncbi:homocysteine-responsive endoplasmic reticulum-resident ubiquitin-like domain member 2 protein [Chelonus insularis]|uniref:homocysteine-responsive endoplasmic reticulum-resident ubiquitin-like domain member 2 protein n=1 Tax=Chelonus insularis TaxID=460826 RepID=UPI001589D5E4|nr:homocysteine-responsive endoplasmic reticulum-resident ubiquitin-like domain member 2 protein [Chelonus insularis]